MQLKSKNPGGSRKVEHFTFEETKESNAVNSPQSPSNFEICQPKSPIVSIVKNVTSSSQMYQTYYEPSGALMSLIKKVNPQASATIEQNRRPSINAGSLLADPRMLHKQLTIADTLHPSSIIVHPHLTATPSHRAGAQSDKTAALETIASEELTSQDDQSLSRIGLAGNGENSVLSSRCNSIEKKSQHG
jgi:hypothetical protein